MPSNIILRLRLALFSLPLLLLCFAPALAEPNTRTIAAWLKANAVPLRTVEPGDDDGDLGLLPGLLGNRRIVAMGEATHGTHDFFQFKHRVFEYLVRHLGFSVFAMETPFLEGALLNDYIQTGQGDPAAILANSYWCWNTREVLELVEWMRRYNLDARHERKLRFYGFDTQKAFVYGWPALRRYFERVDGDFLPLLNDAEARVNAQHQQLSRRDGRQEAVQHKEEVAASLRMIEDRLRRNRDLYVARSSEDEWATLTRAIVLMLREQEDLFLPGFSAGEEWRDKGMADNVDWILNRQQGKLFLWAHNVHLNRDPQYRSNYLDPPYRPRFIPPGEPTPKRMGFFLTKAYPQQLYIVGLEFNQGTFQTQFFDERGGSPKVKAATLGPAPSGTLPALLAKVKAPLYFIDFSRSPRPQAVKQWLSRNQKAHYYGGMMTAVRSFEHIRLDHSYDGLVFVKKTTRAVPLPPQPARNP